MDLHHVRSLTEFFKEHELVVRPNIFEFTSDPQHLMGDYWHKYYQTDNQSLFHMKDAGSRLCRCALEEAVDLGRRARSEDWSDAWLDYEFGAWFDDKMTSEGAKAYKDMMSTRKQTAAHEAIEADRLRRFGFGWPY